MLRDKSDPLWRASNAWGRRYSSARIAEMTKLFGELGAAECSMLVSEGDTLADARFLRAKAAELGDPSMLVRAAQLTTIARQTARDCWELASRMKAAREAAAPNPWAPHYVEVDDGQDDARHDGDAHDDSNEEHDHG